MKRLTCVAVEEVQLFCVVDVVDFTLSSFTLLGVLSLSKIMICQSLIITTTDVESIIFDSLFV